MGIKREFYNMGLDFVKGLRFGFGIKPKRKPKSKKRGLSNDSVRPLDTTCR